VVQTCALPIYHHLSRAVPSLRRAGMTVIGLDRVTKEYARHRHLTRGLKQSLLHLPDLIRITRTHRFFALEDICVTIRKGEAVSIIGANGSGKSTLLGLIAGVIGPQAGTA